MPRDPNVRLAYSTDTGVAEEPKKAKQRRPAQAQPAGPGIRLRLERRASGRLATVVTGLPGNEQSLLALARELKTACGAGGTLKDGALELQGDHRDAVERALTARGLKSKRAGG
ncbi:MAG: translation initiation factor [Vicinamibacteria bacterium]